MSLLNLACFKSEVINLQQAPYPPPGAPVMQQPVMAAGQQQQPAVVYVQQQQQQPPPVNVTVTMQPTAVAQPQQIPNCPPGLEYLSLLSQLLIKQKVELMEAFTGFETNNKVRKAAIAYP